MNYRIKWLILLLICLLLIQKGYSFNRWFKVSPGVRVVGMAVDMRGNIGTTRFDFGGGFNFDIQLEKHIGLDIDFLYLRKGSDVGAGATHLTFHYLSIPTLVKFWVVRKKFSLNIGPVYNILLGANGQVSNINLTENNTSSYDIGLIIGMGYVMANYENGMRLVGDLRFEIDFTDIYTSSSAALFNRAVPYLGIGLNF